MTMQCRRCGRPMPYAGLVAARVMERNTRITAAVTLVLRLLALLGVGVVVALFGPWLRGG